jgi:hypothetical protein
VVYAYCRCNSGHFFEGEACPFDGWSSHASRELLRVVLRLKSVGREHFTVEDLRSAGLTDEILQRCIVVEFGSPSSRFEAISVDHIAVNDASIPIHKAELRFK